VINHYAGGNPVSRTAAVIAPGAVVMAMIYAWGPLSGLHIRPAVTFAFTARGVFPARWVRPYWVVQFAGAICAAIAVVIITAVRGLPSKEERQAAQGGALPILDAPSPNGR
jgi:glycerol uptake facilitator-like aquaporin